MAVVARAGASRVPAEPDFDVVADPHLRELARRGIVKRYRRGTRIVEEGDHGDTMFVVLAGALRSFTEGPGGRELTYGIYGPGECLGEMSLDGGPRSANVVAHEASVCAMVTRATLRARLAEDPELAFTLITRVIHRARLATEHARGMAMLDVYGRLAAVLESQAVDDSEGARVLPRPTTHRELAGLIGASRVMITRLLNDLSAGGYIRIDDRRIRLLKPLPRGW